MLLIGGGTGGPQQRPLGFQCGARSGHIGEAVEEDRNHTSAPAAVSAGDGIERICTKFAWSRFAAVRFFASMFADGIPVRANDFSQSCYDGPSMLPSM